MITAAAGPPAWLTRTGYDPPAEEQIRVDVKYAGLSPPGRPPPVLVFGLGLAVIVAPLTANGMGSAPPRHSGIASAVNNAARLGGLLAVAALPHSRASWASATCARAAYRISPRSRPVAML